ncbi:DUF885 family protein [Chromatocurvus halotolerans]|uniref:Uncharacterized protein (DUF885 family) n=1 Tax=Chromatocurvus halotolerans TaxID=1132028 RepID=A0A4R2KWA5_9GAMM|nr:DUF885 family protein [Chromatocurvus halotolerans]TCO77127.1 uncharacterized protein (DUF885 family) [Chromatocurvus halotolerans]
MSSAVNRAGIVILLLFFAPMLTLPAAATEDPPPGYDRLLTLYRDFRELAVPVVRNGVPDYSPEAMQAQAAELEVLRARLDGIDDSAWPIPSRVDYMLVLAEMRGLDFMHRVMRPWERDPAFYSSTNLGFGPKMHGALRIPALPLSADEAEGLRARLAAVPAIYEAARENLTDPRGDLARLAIEQKRIERNVYKRLSDGLAASDPGLSGLAAGAAAAAEGFMRWLQSIEADLPPHGGVGAEDYDWYLRHVMLFPYTADELMTLAEREYQRSMVFLKMEEHRHRALPMIEPAESMEEFERRRSEADADLLAFLRDDEVMTVPDYLVPVAGEGPYLLPADRDPERAGPFEAPIQRHFFRQTEDRDPRPLRAHNVPGHLLDSLLVQRDERPIRGDRRLFFIDGIRAEGWAFYLEEMIQQLGFLEDRPKAREINYILQAKRAARVKPELMMQANAWTYDEALTSLTTRTPYWMGPDDAIARFDLELYLRQPGYGIGYYMGKVELEKLFAEVAAEQGRDFDIKQFHDDFLAIGRIPIALIRWQMTGRDDEIATMR